MGEVGRRDFLKYGGTLAGIAAVSPKMLRSCGGGTSRPNILVITVDDMRYDHLLFMTETLSRFSGGTIFTGCRQNVSLCQPHRVGFLTGQYARSNGVYSNGQYMANPDHSIGPWMRTAGYATAMIGKYPQPFGGAPLAGWTTQRTFTPTTEQFAYGFQVFDGATVSSPTGYQTDYIASQVQLFTQGASRPWFCWATPSNPHVGAGWIFEPEPEHANDYSDLEWPVVDDDLTDKPSWMQAQPPLNEGQVLGIQDNARGQLRELASVDEAIAAIFASLDQSGQLSNTVVVFTSDNGVLYGEHRMFRLIAADKNVPYEPSMHVPLVATGPGFSATTNGAAVCGQDITATCLAIAGAVPTTAIDGADLRSADVNRVVLHERSSVVNPVPGMPDGAGVSTANRKLWRHEAEDPDQYELYLLDVDPNEDTNVAYDPAYLDERTQLEGQLDALLQV